MKIEAPRQIARTREALSGGQIAAEDTQNDLG